MSRIKTLKIHDSQIFLPDIPYTVKSGTVTAGEQNGATIEMTRQSDGTVVVDVKKDNKKARVYVPTGGYSYAVEAPEASASPKK
jgi:formylmethanofuran dehydrogenase subunit D